MSRASHAHRSGGRAFGTNTLITTASLALTLVGWAVLAANEAEPTVPIAINVPTSTPPPPTLPVVPTLVPEPDWASLVQPTAVPAPQIAPPPTPRTAAAPAPIARPPRPAAVTRSSR